MRHRGQPILVIGGGPSVLTDIEKVPGARDMVCVSANAHGFKVPGVKPSYIVSNDHIHTQTKELMAPMLRKFGVPIVARHWWADYRMTEWISKGNSGMNAIGVAALLGGWPVIPLGIDCFQKLTYFHSPVETNVSLGRPVGYWERRLKRMWSHLRGACVRPVSGPLCKEYRRYDPGEALPEFVVPDEFKPYEGQKAYRVRTLKAFQDPHDPRVTIPAGVELAVSDIQQVQWMRLGLCEAIGEASTVNPEQATRERRRRLGMGT